MKKICYFLLLLITVTTIGCDVADAVKGSKFLKPTKAPNTTEFNARTTEEQYFKNVKYSKKGIYAHVPKKYMDYVFDKKYPLSDDTTEFSAEYHTTDSEIGKNPYAIDIHAKVHFVGETYSCRKGYMGNLPFKLGLTNTNNSYKNNETDKQEYDDWVNFYHEIHKPEFIDECDYSQKGFPIPKVADYNPDLRSKIHFVGETYECKEGFIGSLSFKRLTGVIDSYKNGEIDKQEYDDWVDFFHEVHKPKYVNTCK